MNELSMQLLRKKNTVCGQLSSGRIGTELGQHHLMRESKILTGGWWRILQGTLKKLVSENGMGRLHDRESGKLKWERDVDHSGLCLTFN